ncbi:uncharacterized protein alr4393-like [Rhipicephalus sanguineus]|uniref:uncharacterized protein alr4393-like n=1 Tax=Rhipicephalus sanguineus TaxID=34632 RepID=UPI001895818B|nr:uncharacterized protein alr4393-like [Rhipicephalus sanguineus]
MALEDSTIGDTAGDCDDLEAEVRKSRDDNDATAVAKRKKTRNAKRKRKYDVYKAKATTMINEKDRHISDLKDMVSTLEKQLEQQLDEVAADSLECSRMERLFADAQQRLKDQQQQYANFEEQLLERDTELTNEYQLDELRMQAADLRAQLSQAQQDCDRQFSRAQAPTAELSKKEAECKENQERIQGLEAGQNTLLAKVSKLEKQLRALLHNLKKNETEQKTTKEELAKLKQVLAVAEIKNGRLKAKLQARQKQADKQSKLEEEGTQLQEFVERVAA